jgi:regulator of RNase E activity RraA
VKHYRWVEIFPGSVIICDTSGVILAMNKKAEEVTEKCGGKKLIGSNMLDCHNERTRKKLTHLMEKRETNIYTYRERRYKETDLSDPMV